MKELEDHTWFPGFLRKMQMEYIGFIAAFSGAYKPFARYLRSVQPIPVEFTDLCSGSGHPATDILLKVPGFVSLTLTDKFPQPIRYSDHRVVYLTRPVDVLSHEFNAATCYTMFNAFHHFADDDKSKILKRISETHARVFIVEPLEPTFICMVKILLTTTIGCLLLTPFVKPFSWMRLFFTYVLPVNIFTISYDGVLSVLKSKTLQQYENLINKAGISASVTRLSSPISSLIVISINAR